MSGNRIMRMKTDLTGKMLMQMENVYIKNVKSFFFPSTICRFEQFKILNELPIHLVHGY